MASTEICQSLINRPASLIASDVKVPLERRLFAGLTGRAKVKTAPQAWPGPSSACNQRRLEATTLTTLITAVILARHLGHNILASQQQSD